MKAFNEFFWMWLASVSPIIFGSFFIILGYKDINYLDLVIKTFFDGPVFAYVATMIAPFLYLTHLYLKKDREHKALRFGGFAILASIIVVIITSGLMHKKQLDNYKAKEYSSIVSVESQGTSSKDKTSIPSEKEQSNPSKEIVKINYSMTNSDWAAFFCYLLSLFIWFYSIYLNQKEAPDLQENSRKMSKKHGELMNDVFDELDKEVRYE